MNPVPLTSASGPRRWHLGRNGPSEPRGWSLLQARFRRRPRERRRMPTGDSGFRSNGDRNQSILCPRAQIASLTVMADSPASPGRSARSRSVCSAVVDQPTASSVRAFSVSTPARSLPEGNRSDDRVKVGATYRHRHDRGSDGIEGALRACAFADPSQRDRVTPVVPAIPIARARTWAWDAKSGSTIPPPGGDRVIATSDSKKEPRLHQTSELSTGMLVDLSKSSLLRRIRTES